PPWCITSFPYTTLFRSVFVGRSFERLRDWRSGPEAEFRRLLVRAGSDLAEIVADGKRITEFRGSVRLPAFFRRPFGPGWALVGEDRKSTRLNSSHVKIS